MLTLTSLITRSFLTVLTVGSLAVVADGAVRSQLERAVRSNLTYVGHVSDPAPLTRPIDRYTAKGLDRNRLSATVLMVGASDAQ